MTIKEMTELYKKMYGSEVTVYFVQYGEINPTRSTVEGEKVKIEEAIGLLRHHYGEQFDMAIDALEKQIPKKCDKRGCCKCGCMLADWNYCPKCGQKIDRSDW